MNLYSNVTYGLQGLFAASQYVSGKEWDAYVQQLDIPNNYSGISGLGYIPRIMKSDLRSYPYPIYPLTDKSEYFPSTYRSLFSNAPTTPLGFDVSSDLTRNLVLRTAIDSNKAVGTGIVFALADHAPTFSIYAPIYKNGSSTDTVDERRAAAAGIVSVSFRLARLFSGLTTDPVFRKDIGLEIYDTPTLEAASTSTLLYSSVKDDNLRALNSAKGLIRSTHINFGDRVWTLYFWTLSSYQMSGTEQYTPFIVLGTGITISILLALILYFLAESRKRAVSYAEKLTKDLRKTNEELTVAKVKDDAILASMTEGLVVADMTGRMIMFNPAAEKILGIGLMQADPGEWAKVYGVFKTDMITPFPAADYPIVRALTGEEVRNVEQYISNTHLKKGIFIQVSGSPLRTTEGNIIGSLAVFRDITREKEIDRAKSEFVSVASHELRTPLGIIKWYIESIKKNEYITKAPEKAKDYLNEVDKSNERLLELVRNLLTVAHIDESHIKDAPRLTDVVRLTKETIDQMKIIGGSKGITIDGTFPEFLIPEIVIDDKRFKEVIENLLTNSIKYSKENGKVTVGVSVELETMSISIKDNGIGIPEDATHGMFTRFFRANNAVKSNAEGTGLGLYVVKSYVEAWGGKIWYESKEGVGTTFFVTIPLKNNKK